MPLNKEIKLIAERGKRWIRSFSQEHYDTFKYKEPHHSKWHKWYNLTRKVPSKKKEDISFAIKFYCLAFRKPIFLKF